MRTPWGSWGRFQSRAFSSVPQEELRLKPLLQEVHRDREASERVVEADLALHADLVRRYAPLEEVGQLLHVLQLHERERVARVEVFQIGRASCRERGCQYG